MAYSQAHRLPLPSDPSSSTRSRIDQANLSFVVGQKKLSPNFEAYKLVQDDSSSSGTVSYALPSRPPSLAELYKSRQDGKSTRDGSLSFTGLGYKQTKERALHQVIVPATGRRSADEPFAAYIDANGFVIALAYDPQADKVAGHPVHRLAIDELAGSLPSLASVSPTRWLACSGRTVVLVELQRVKLANGGAVRWTSGSELRWKLPQEGTIKACRVLDGKIRLFLQSIKPVIASKVGQTEEDMKGLGFQRDAKAQAGSSTGAQSGHSSTVFEVQLVELDSKEGVAEASIPDARSLWAVQGEEPIIIAKLDEHETLLGAEAPFTASKRRAVSTAVGAQSRQVTLASASATASQPTTASRGRRRAPHFSWAQTGDTVTIAFALPSWITKAHIRAHFSLGALSLSFTQEALDLLSTHSTSAKITELDNSTTSASDAVDDDHTHAAKLIASGRYVSRSTWAEIDPTGSLWTLERARGLSLLTLHLEKRHEGTRWMQVFADRTGTRSNGQGRKQATSQSQTQLSFAQARSALEHAVSGGTGGDEEEEIDDDDEAEDNEDDVPETMDPSELISMLEGMEKYTVDEDSVQRGSDFGVDRTGLSSASLDQPSLLKDNLEEEDANVGRNFVLSSVPTRDGTTVNSSKEGETILLATPLPGHNEQGLIVIKHDLDGAVFSSAASSWDHVATMPALAFVLASKRDAQRVHIHKRTSEAGQEDRYVVLAFESAPQVTGSGSTAAASGAGNLFLYYSPSSPDTKNAASRVVRLGASDSNDAGGGASGALLGVCSARLPRSGGSEGEEQLEDTLICLCENRILLLRGVL